MIEEIINNITENTIINIGKKFIEINGDNIPNSDLPDDIAISDSVSYGISDIAYHVHIENGKKLINVFFMGIAEFIVVDYENIIHIDYRLILRKEKINNLLLK